MKLLLARNKKYVYFFSNCTYQSGCKPAELQGTGGPSEHLRQKRFLAKNYPSPATFDFNISVTAKKEQVVTLQVFDAQGHLLRTQQHRINEGFTKINLLTARMKPGTYIVQLKSSLGFFPHLKQVIKA